MPINADKPQLWKADTRASVDQFNQWFMKFAPKAYRVFIWNRSQATAHNVYLMLYPKSRLQEALTNHPELASRVFEALQSITLAQLLSEGRVYGGGLHKVEPKELAQIPARAVLESIDGHIRIEHQEKLFA